MLILLTFSLPFFSLGRILPIPFILRMSSITFLVHLVTPLWSPSFWQRLLLEPFVGEIYLSVLLYSPLLNKILLYSKVGALHQSLPSFEDLELYIKELRDAKHKEGLPSVSVLPSVFITHYLDCYFNNSAVLLLCGPIFLGLSGKASLLFICLSLLCGN